MSSSPSIALGIGLALGTTFLSALGIVCKKRAHDNAAYAGKRIRSFRKPEWVAGLFCLIVSALVSVLVTYLLGQQIASAMAAATIVWSLFLRHWLLKEGLHKYDLVCSFLLTLGVAVILVMGTREKPASPNDPTLLFAVAIARPAAQISLGVWGAAVVLLAVTLHTRGCAFPTGGYRALFLILLSALFSAATGVFSKSLGSLLAYAFSVSPALPFSSPVLYLSTVFLVACVVLQLIHLNLALKIARASLVMPFYQSLFVLCGVATGWGFWGEGSTRSGAETLGLCMGLVLIFSGLLIVLVGHASHPAHNAQAGEAAVVVPNSGCDPTTPPPHTAASPSGPPTALHIITLPIGDTASGKKRGSSAPPRVFATHESSSFAALHHRKKIKKVSYSNEDARFEHVGGVK